MSNLEIAIQKIKTLPPEQCNKVLEYIEFLEFQTHKISLKSIEANSPRISFAEVAQEFVGCLDSNLEDLSHNPQYLKGFGE